MSRKAINTIILTVFFLCLSVMIYINIKPHPRVQHARVATLAKADGGLAERSSTVTVDAVTPSAQYDAERLLNTFGRDPFIDLLKKKDTAGTPSPDKIKKKALVPDNRTYREPLEVSIIIMTKDRKSAVINGLQYSEGDMIRGHTEVTSIQKGGVVFTDKDRQWYVPLRNSSITIMQEPRPGARKYE